MTFVRNTKRSTPRHITVTLMKAKEKEKTLKATREKWLITCKEFLTFHQNKGSQKTV